jgi:hypothetical protein
MNAAPANVHIGNVAEYNRQFFPHDFRLDHLSAWDVDGHHYGCLAPFYTSNPGLVVLPLELLSDWAELQTSVLSWPCLDLRSGLLSDSPDLCEAILASKSLLTSVSTAVETLSAQLIPWGRSPGYDRLERRVMEPIGHSLPVEGAKKPQSYFESKSDAARRFRSAAGLADGVVVPYQETCYSVDEAAAVLAGRLADTGRAHVLKSDFSVGGFGTRVFRPDEAREFDRARSLLAALIEEDAIFTVLPLVVQEYIPHTPGLRSQPTFNGEVMRDGRVEVRGCAVMDVVGTVYAGALVGAGLDETTRSRMEGFGLAVGELMAAEGYCGWYDIDFVRTDDDLLMPTETNARRTGPTVAFSIAENLSGHGHEPVVVRTNDIVRLSRPVSEQDMLARYVDRSRGIATREIAFVPTLVTATDQEFPYFGFATIGRDAESVNSATEALAVALRQEE